MMFVDLSDRPVEAHCEAEHLFVTLADGRRMQTPLWWYPRLLKADDAARRMIKLMPMGMHWPEIDEDISIESMLRGEKAWDAVNPANEAASNMKMPLIHRSQDEIDTHDTMLIEGAYCSIDYRSKILNRIHETFDSGIRHIGDFNYNQLFATTDTLLDVQSILFDAEKSIWPESQTIGQLWMYGTLQALAVQQKATEQLLECFKLKDHPDAIPILMEIMDFRISAVGHPHNHQNKKIAHRGCTFLCGRSHGSNTQFRIVTYENFKKRVSRIIDVPELIGRQQTAIQMNLSQVWSFIKDNPKFDRPVAQND